MFNAPKTVLFGVGTINNLGERAQEVTSVHKSKGKRAIIITDAGVLGAGLIDAPKKSLESLEFTTEIFSDAKPEPDIEDYDVVVNKVREGNYDIVIGIGGGSAMDQAKLAAAFATHTGSTKPYFEGKSKLDKVGLPSILVPTTAGTGSEITPISVAVGDNGIKTSVYDRRYLFTDLALVDPTLTLSLPPGPTAASGIDALAHAMMRFMGSDPMNPLSASLIDKSIHLIANNLRLAYANGTNIEARTNMSYAATIGFMGTLASPGQGGSISHPLGEVFGPLYKIPHGVACGLSLIYDMKFQLMASPDKLITIAKMFGEQTEGLSKYSAAMKGVEAVKSLVEDINIPTSLQAWNIPKEDLPKLSKLTYQRAVGWLKKSPRKITEKAITKLYEDMWEGDTTSYRF